MDELHGEKDLLLPEDSHENYEHGFNPETVQIHTGMNVSSFHESVCDSHANIMGNVFHNASPYLYPCTIEYSLICAGILFVMWKNVGQGENEKNENA